MCCPGTPILLARYLSCQHPFFTSLPSPTGLVSEPPPVHLLSMSHFVVTTIAVASCGKGVTPRCQARGIGGRLWLAVLTRFLFVPHTGPQARVANSFCRWGLVCFSVKSLTNGGGGWLQICFSGVVPSFCLPLCSLPLYTAQTQLTFSRNEWRFLVT